MTASVAEYMPVLRVALDLPLHRLFDYVAEALTPADVGLRVRVPFGRGERLGVIVEVAADSDWPVDQLKPATEILRDLPPLTADFFRLCQFASTYYQAAFGEVVMQALPVGLKRIDPPDRRNARATKSPPPIQPPQLTDEQARAVAAVDPAAGFSAHLLHGVTGSGKTEVYLRLIDKTLALGRPGLAAGAGNQPDAAARRPRPRRASLRPGSFRCTANWPKRRASATGGRPLPARPASCSVPAWPSSRPCRGWG